MDATFAVQIYLDGRPFDLQEFRFYALNYGHVNSWNARVIVPAETVSPGVHTMTMVIDPFDDVSEADETDNVSTQTLEWSEALPIAPPITYTDDQLRLMLMPLLNGMLQEQRTVDELAAEGQDWTPIIQDIADAAYYLVTGKSYRDEVLVLVMATHSEYVYEHAKECMGGTLESMSLATFKHKYESRVCARPVFWPPYAYTDNAFDYEAIIMHTEANPGNVLITLLHELGHANQRLTYPLRIYGNLPHAYNLAINEAEAQTFEAVLLRRIEDFLGIRFGYVDTPDNVNRLDQSIEFWSAIAEDEEHSGIGEEHGIGYVLMWLTTLEDPAGLGLREELETKGRLSWQTSHDVFKFFASMDENEVWSWIDEMLAAKGDVAERYRKIARSRLISGLDVDEEAHPQFFRAIMLAP